MRVPPKALLREMLMQLDETHKWVNLSDGGHIENLAAMELLRRRCQFIILGDGEADPNLYFNGLATLICFEPDFPHQSTADQQFDEAQFECYRSLGQHIGAEALTALKLADSEAPVTCAAFKQQLTAQGDHVAAF